MLHSKKDFTECLKKIINPVEKYFTPGCAGLKLGGTGVIYGENTARMEGFARIFWGLAPLWGGGEDSIFDEKVLQGIINGTDPSHPEYWGKIEDGDQLLVETAALGLGLALAPHKLWEPLNEKQKNNLYNWLSQANVAVAGDNNWKFFAVLVNLGFKRVGMPVDMKIVEHGKERFESFYRGDGWYKDGNSDQADYYIAFAIHFYSLIYAKLMENDDPETARKYKERAMLFAKEFIYWFAEDGSALCFGRSLTYRFAQCCFWSACIFAGIEPFPLGVMKGIISRHLEWWMNKPIFDNDGILTIGYGYPNLNMAEFYNGFGSPYWALKSFLFLALDENHEFFRVKAEPLPALESVKALPWADMIIQRRGGDVFALTSGQWAEWGPTHVSSKYSKFAYSSKYGFSVPRNQEGIEKASPDSMLAFEIDGIIFVRRKCDEKRIEDGKIYSRWSPFKGINVETVLIPTEYGHLRKHNVECEYDCVAYDCGFASSGAEVKVEGAGEIIPVRCEPNTNLTDPYARMNAVKYNLKKGKNEIETKVFY